MNKCDVGSYVVGIESCSLLFIHTSTLATTSFIVIPTLSFQKRFNFCLARNVMILNLQLSIIHLHVPRAC